MYCNWCDVILIMRHRERLGNRSRCSQYLELILETILTRFWVKYLCKKARICENLDLPTNPGFLAKIGLFAHTFVLKACKRVSSINSSYCEDLDGFPDLFWCYSITEIILKNTNWGTSVYKSNKFWKQLSMVGVQKNLLFKH